MNATIIETVLFKLNDDVNDQAFSEAIKQSNKFVTSCKGFVARRLSCNNDGQWIEHIEWETMSNAKAAASKIGSDRNTQAFIGAINGDSVQMFHTQIKTALDAN
ncbi:hypothetical protein ACFO4O_02275 [Glaciecola siphonariae]|uniref:ABM domain-containing protein n=1 Tax=Glaciecola siphonariae TaxID=521012 RepID=A0ABV9LRU1_9ALTE